MGTSQVQGGLDPRVPCPGVFGGFGEGLLSAGGTSFQASYDPRRWEKWKSVSRTERGGREEGFSPEEVKGEFRGLLGIKKEHEISEGFSSRQKKRWLIALREKNEGL